MRGRFDFLGSHQGFARPRHLRRLGWQVLQKFLKERIWICQGQLHGMLLLWTGGAHISSMQYALISYDLQLILALMSTTPSPLRRLVHRPAPACHALRCPCRVMATRGPQGLLSSRLARRGTQERDAPQPCGDAS